MGLEIDSAACAQNTFLKSTTEVGIESNPTKKANSVQILPVPEVGVAIEETKQNDVPQDKIDTTLSEVGTCMSTFTNWIYKLFTD